MKVHLMSNNRFDLSALVGLLVGLAMSAPASAQDSPDLVWEVAGDAGGVSAVAFSPDGQQVASGAGSQDPTAKVWDAADGTALATFPAPSRSGATSTGVASLAFSPAGLLAVGGFVFSTGYPVPGGAADVWRLADETMVHSFGGSYVSFSADGTLLATGGGGANHALLVHEIPSETLVAVFSDGGGILSPDGQTVATGFNFEGEVTLWDVASCSGPSAMAARCARSLSRLIVRCSPPPAEASIRIPRSSSGAFRMVRCFILCSATAFSSVPLISHPMDRC